jgi:hypothetical protein
MDYFQVIAYKLFNQHDDVIINSSEPVLKIQNIIQCARQLYEKNRVSTEMFRACAYDLQRLNFNLIKGIINASDKIPVGIFRVSLLPVTWQDIYKSLPYKPTDTVTLQIRFTYSKDARTDHKYAMQLDDVRNAIQDQEAYLTETEIPYENRILIRPHMTILQTGESFPDMNAERCGANLCPNSNDEHCVECSKCKKQYCVNHIKTHSCKGVCGNPTCPKVKPLHKCAGCEKMRYCSSECQTYDWLVHRTFCAAMKSQDI